MSSVPVVHPKLPLAELFLDKFGQDHVTDSNADDLKDHWSHDDHEGERKRLLEVFSALSRDKRIRVSLISGDVHVAAWGTAYRRDLPASETWSQMHQFTSSDRIVYCLERVSDYRDFERLCSALLAGTDYPGIDPLGGTGVVFVGEFGPWYSAKNGEFHLPPDKAEALLRGTIATYQEQDGRQLKEIFLHSNSGINVEEYRGFQRALPEGVELVAIRVRQDRGGMRLYRHDEHPEAGQRGKHPVQRGVFWQRAARHGLLYTNGFKPRIATYDGFEVPVPLSISIQHGDGDILQVAKDILGLTKLNYNSCQLGEGRPITVKYSDRVGEILLANPGLTSDKWRHNFKYYA